MERAVQEIVTEAGKGGLAKRMGCCNPLDVQYEELCTGIFTIISNSRLRQKIYFVNPNSK